MPIRITYAPGFYAEWHTGARTINLYAIAPDGTHINFDCASFGYDKPDNSTTELEALAVVLAGICTHQSLDDCGCTCHHLECPDCGLLIDTPDVYPVDEEA